MGQGYEKYHITQAVYLKVGISYCIQMWNYESKNIKFKIQTYSQ